MLVNRQTCRITMYLQQSHPQLKYHQQYLYIIHSCIFWKDFRPLDCWSARMASEVSLCELGWCRGQGESTWKLRFVGNWKDCSCYWELKKTQMEIRKYIWPKDARRPHEENVMRMPLNLTSNALGTGLGFETQDIRTGWYCGWLAPSKCIKCFGRSWLFF